MITILQEPGSKVFSRNPIVYLVATNTAINTAGLAIQAKIYFNGQLITTFSLKPNTAGEARIDIKVVIDSLLKFSKPAPQGGIELLPDQQGDFYVEFHEVTTATPVDASPQTSITSTAYKGGLALHTAMNSSLYFSWSNAFNSYLTWHESGRKVAPWQQHWITYLHLGASAIAGTKVNARVAYTDGSVVDTPTLFAFPLGAINADTLYRFPAGFDRWAIETYQPGKIAVWYELQLLDVDDNLLVPAYRFALDYSPDYERVILHYHGPLGSYEAVRLRGEHDENIDRAAELHEVYTTGVNSLDALEAQNAMTGHSQQRTFKSNFSYTDNSRQHQLRNELFNGDAVQRLVNGRWWPVVVTNKNMEAGRLSNQVKTLPVEWQYAFRDENFAPDDVNIPFCTPVAVGAYSFPNATVGGLYSGSIAITGSGPVTAINVNLPAWVDTYALTDTAFTYSGTPTAAGVDAFDYEIANGCGTVLISGSITVLAACVPVDIDYSLPELTAATIGLPYSLNIPLTGSGPFTLDSYLLPAGFTAAIVGSNIVVSGETEFTEPAPDEDVSFTVSNACGTDTYTGVMDINEPAPTASLTYTYENVMTSGGSFKIWVNGSLVVDLEDDEGPETMLIPDGATIEIIVTASPTSVAELTISGDHTFSDAQNDTVSETFTAVAGDIYTATGKSND